MKKDQKLAKEERKQKLKLLAMLQKKLSPKQKKWLKGKKPFNFRRDGSFKIVRNMDDINATINDCLDALKMEDNFYPEDGRISNKHLLQLVELFHLEDKVESLIFQLT